MSTIGISLWSLQPLMYKSNACLQDMLKPITEMGVEYVDLVEDFVPCHPHVDLVRMRELKRILKEYGLKVGQVWFYVDPLAQMFEVSYKRAVDDMKELIMATAMLEAKYIITPFRFLLPGLDTDTGNARYIEWLRDVMPTVEAEGIRYGVECSRSNMLHYAIPTVKAVGSNAFKLCPDFEAWRLPTPDLPMNHVETAEAMTPATIETLQQMLPYTEPIHAKMLSFDDAGNEPHFPMDGIFGALNDAKKDYHFVVEYEGWTPDACHGKPVDCVAETRKCVELIRKYMNMR